jgi:mRNA interferase MazF
MRPALIIQNDVGNKYSPNVIVASITTAIPDASYPFLVICTPSESGLERKSAIDLASVMAISKSRLGDKCGGLTPTKMLEVGKAIKESLGLV